MAEEIEWFVGIDWASQSHQVCLVNARGECLGERAVAHGGAGIEELCDWLMARTGATPEVIGVAIEMTQGPVVEALLERGFCVYGHFVARINIRAQSGPRSDIYVRRTYSGRPSSSIRFSEATAMATSVICRPLVRERSASPITRL